MLNKFGVPPKSIRLLSSLHEHVEVHFSVVGARKSFDSTIGVKQGDTLGPLLFIFYIAGIMQVWRKTTTTKPIIFKTADDFVLTGRNHTLQGDLFTFRDSEYADDTAAVFGDREDLEKGTNELIEVFGRFGMDVHTGHANKPSKSEAMFVPKPTQSYDNPETFDNATITPINTGNQTSIPLVKEFRYLGSVQSSLASDSPDVEARVSAASRAFGSLRSTLFKNRSISFKAKAAVYKSLVIPIVLYGSETWTLRKSDENTQESFNNACLRSMYNITKYAQRVSHVSSNDIRNSLQLPTLISLRRRNLLRWTGHIARMPYSRLPKKMLSCWINSRRPTGAPEMTFGRSLTRTIQQAGITRWSSRAQDRKGWRSIISNSD